MASVTFERVGKTYPDGTPSRRRTSNLEIADGEFIVFVGPSGCGKTTALRMVAGLEEITERRAPDRRRVVNDLDPRERDIAMVFQNYALYPHMTVFDNIAFPLAARGVPKARDRASASSETATLLELDGAPQAAAARTSRAASASAWRWAARSSAQPQVFLMDEPLSNLDAKLRVQMRVEIARLQRELGVTTIYVTHDQVEAMTMGDRIAVMRKGVLQQLGPPQELYDEPANLFVATFVGSPGDEPLSSKSPGRARRWPRPRHRLAADRPPAERGHRRARCLPTPAVSPWGPAGAPRRAGSWAGLPRLRGTTTLVETLGADRLVYLSVAAAPWSPKRCSKRPPTFGGRRSRPWPWRRTSQSLRQSHATTPTRTSRSASTQEVAIRPDKMHFFDLASGARI